MVSQAYIQVKNKHPNEHDLDDMFLVVLAKHLAEFLELMEGAW